MQDRSYCYTNSTDIKQHPVLTFDAVMQVQSQPSDMQGLALWLTQRHDKATAAQSQQLDNLYRLLATAAGLAAPAAQEALLRQAIEAHFAGPAAGGAEEADPHSSGLVRVHLCCS